MSRIAKLENMHLIGNYNRNAIKVNKSAKKEYERLYSECLLSPLSFPKASNDTLTIALLNTSSLRRHSNSPSLFLQNMKSWIDEKKHIYCLVISIWMLCVQIHIQT